MKDSSARVHVHVGAFFKITFLFLNAEGEGNRPLRRNENTPQRHLCYEKEKSHEAVNDRTAWWLRSYLNGTRGIARSHSERLVPFEEHSIAFSLRMDQVQVLSAICKKLNNDIELLAKQVSQRESAVSQLNRNQQTHDDQLRQLNLELQLKFTKTDTAVQKLQTDVEQLSYGLREVLNNQQESQRVNVQRHQELKAEVNACRFRTDLSPPSASLVVCSDTFFQEVPCTRVSKSSTTKAKSSAMAIR